MNISKPFVTESRSHAKKIISKGFEVERLSQRKAIFPQVEVKKKTHFFLLDQTEKILKGR